MSDSMVNCRGVCDCCANYRPQKETFRVVWRYLEVKYSQAHNPFDGGALVGLRKARAEEVATYLNKMDHGTFRIELEKEIDACKLPR